MQFLKIIQGTKGYNLINKFQGFEQKLSIFQLVEGSAFSLGFPDPLICVYCNDQVVAMPLAEGKQFYVSTVQDIEHTVREDDNF